MVRWRATTGCRARDDVGDVGDDRGRRHDQRSPRSGDQQPPRCHEKTCTLLKWIVPASAFGQALDCCSPNSIVSGPLPCPPSGTKVICPEPVRKPRTCLVPNQSPLLLCTPISTKVKSSTAAES